MPIGMFTRFLFLWLVAWLVLSIGINAQAEVMNLKRCIDLARQNSSQVGLTQDRQDWEGEKLAAARRRYLPRMEVELNEQPKVDFFGRPLEEDNVFTSEVKLTQPIYQPLLSYNRQQAEQGIVRAQVERDKAAQEAALEVAPVYYKALAAQKVWEVRRGLEAKAKELAALAKKGVDLGQQTKGDQLAAEARVFQVAFDLAKSRSEADTALLRLKELIGLSPEQALKVMPEEPMYEPPEQSEGLLERAMDKNPILSFAQADEKYHQLGMEAAASQEGSRLNLVGRFGLEGDYFPGEEKFYGVMMVWEMSLGDNSLRAFYDFEHQFENPTAFYYEERNLRRKGVKLSFLDGSSVAPAVAEARLKRRQAHFNLLDNRKELKTRLLSLWQEHKKQIALSLLAQKEKALQLERLSAARTRLLAGSVTPAEVLETELDLAEAQVKLVQSRWEDARIRALLCLLSGMDLKCKEVK
ncbi:MAG: TolC family protein [Desulfarculaceae bacterium]|jgi:outer membrane protein TolC